MSNDLTLEMIEREPEEYDPEFQVACETCGTLMSKEGAVPPFYDHATGYHYCAQHEPAPHSKETAMDETRELLRAFVEKSLAVMRDANGEVTVSYCTLCRPESADSHRHHCLVDQAQANLARLDAQEGEKPDSCALCKDRPGWRDPGPHVPGHPRLVPCDHKPAPAEGLPPELPEDAGPMNWRSYCHTTDMGAVAMKEANALRTHCRHLHSTATRIIAEKDAEIERLKGLHGAMVNNLNSGQYRAFVAERSRDALQSEITTLRSKLDEATGLLRRWFQGGCPECSGDCSAANPPPISCPISETRTFFSTLKPKPVDTPCGDDYEERLNCPRAGEYGHKGCGKCPTHGVLRAECGCLLFPKGTK